MALLHSNMQKNLLSLINGEHPATGNAQEGESHLQRLSETAPNTLW